MKDTVLLLMFLLLSGCAFFGGYQVSHSRSTGLVDFLYPNGEIPESLSNPVLNLPLNVGLAFIPEQGRRSTFPADLQVALLDEMKDAFQSKDYIDEIKVIPSMYLSHGQGGSALSSIKRNFNVDVLALVSYDQITHRTDNIKSLSYLTIVGAFIFKGSEFDNSTLLDVVVLDTASHRILFRAAGIHQSQGEYAEAHGHELIRQQQQTDFKQAMANMSDNLNQELGLFEERLKNRDTETEITVQAKPGYKMAFNLPELMLLFMVVLAVFVRRSQ